MKRPDIDKPWMGKDVKFLKIEELAERVGKGYIESIKFDKRGIVTVVDSSRFHRVEFYKCGIVKMYELGLEIIQKKRTRAITNISASTYEAFFEDNTKVVCDGFKLFFEYRPNNWIKRY